MAECREAAIEIANATIDAYGAAASANACDLFDEVMEAEGVQAPPAQAYGDVREEAISRYVHREAGDLDGSQESRSAFADAIGQLAERETRMVASQTVERNVEQAAKTKSGKHVRYARVPTSFVPCEWCAMLASRGFVYKSAENAEAASHHHCSCTMVPGVKGSTKVAGYDPQHYERVYRASRIGEAVRRFEDEGTEESYDRNVRSLIRSLSADAPIDARFGAKPKVKELHTAITLSESGRSVMFLPENAPEGLKNIDALVDGRLFEFKCPEQPKVDTSTSRDPLRFVENNLNDAKGQFLGGHFDVDGETIVHGGPIRVVFDSRGRDFPDDQVRERLARKKEERRIDEILFVGHSGEVEEIEGGAQFLIQDQSASNESIAPISRSFNGRTPESGSGNRGSSPQREARNLD